MKSMLGGFRNVGGLKGAHHHYNRDHHFQSKLSTIIVLILQKECEQFGLSFEFMNRFFDFTSSVECILDILIF